MNRETFLKELGAALSNLSQAEREEAVTYYDEMIRDAVEAGQDEETAVGRLGAPAGPVQVQRGLARSRQGRNFKRSGASDFNGSWQ